MSFCPSPGSAMVCAADGSGWGEVPCPPGHLCLEGRCVDYPCSPGEKSCTDSTTVSGCLADGDGGYAWTTLEICDGLCQAAACVPRCTFDVKQNLGKACSHFVLGIEGTGQGECPDAGLMVVPSSDDDRLVVFDIAADPPVEVAAFPTCQNPSRIMLLEDGGAIATCRDDGRVVRHGPQGAIEWDTQLPGPCEAVRGVARQPDGRLFVGCTSTRNVHELDPEGGAVLQTVHTEVAVYGLDVDEGAVYATDYLALVRVDTSGPQLEVAWTVAAQGYGIAVDGHARVWLTEPPGLVAYHAGDGSVEREVDLQQVPELSGILPDSDNPGCNGVTVAIDGRIVAGCGSLADVVAIYDPLTEEVEVLTLPALDAHPRGVAVDVAGNVYSVNRESHTVTRFPALATPEGETAAPTSFGHGALSAPYGYSGDLTALHDCVLEGRGPTVWTSETLDQGAADTKWLAVEWKATVPSGAGLVVRWRVDSGPWSVAAQNGGALAPPPAEVVGQRFQVRVEMTAGPEATPTLHDVAVFYE